MLAAKTDLRIGQGYKLLEDDFAASAEVLIFNANSAVDTSFGLGVPSELNFYEENKTLTVLEEFEDKASYVQYRLRQLKVGNRFNVDSAIFNVDVKAGCNVKNEKTRTNSTSTNEMSFLLERRLFKLTLKDTEGKYVFSDRFKNDVHALPHKYEKSNKECARLLKNFFEVNRPSCCFYEHYICLIAPVGRGMKFLIPLLSSSLCPRWLTPC